MHEGAKLLRVLSDKTRISVIEQLVKSPMCVGDLNENLRIEQSLLSQHLRTLRENGIVDAQRIGKKVQYSLSDVFTKNREGRSLDLGCCELKFRK